MKRKRNMSLIASSILAAWGFSLCCMLPLVAFMLGASRIAAASSWIEPLRPYFVVCTGLILGFAWYRKLGHQGHHCATTKPPSFWQ